MGVQFSAMVEDAGAPGALQQVTGARCVLGQAPPGQRAPAAHAPGRTLRSLRWLGVAAFTASLGCGAVYPELSAPLRAAPAGRELVPPPPKDLLFVTVKSAQIPSTTRDGRKWDAIGGAAPDPYAIFFLGDRELFRTPVQANTLTPSWPNQKRANYRIPQGSKVRVELWDSNPVNNHPICVHKLSSLKEEAYQGELSFDCASGARVVLKIEPAHAKLGLGFYYELRTERIFVSRVLQESPAARAGLLKGDEIVEIEGKSVKQFEDGEAQSLINANATTGVKLTIKLHGGELRTVSLKNGAIYPVHSEGIPLD